VKKFAKIINLLNDNEFEFVSYQKDNDSAGYILSFYQEPQKPPLKEDWFLEKEELLSFAESEFGIEVDAWKDF
jgi:hypothetical protein